MDSQEMENTRKHAPVAVIILNWNGRKLLETFLPSVVENSDPEVSDIIVADNGSDDDSVAFLEANFPGVSVWKFDRNYGFAEGYNKAVGLAEGYRFVVLLNSDVAVAPKWDSILYRYMLANPDVAAVQPKILSYNEPANFEYAGAAGGFIDRNGYPYCRGRLFGVCEADSGQYDYNMDVFWATGACMMIVRDVYIKAGGLDASFFAHMEEIDLCWRIHLMGYRIVAVPESKIFHLGGGSLPAENPRKTYLNFRNNLLMLHKNLPRKEGRRFLFKRRLLDTLAWGKYMLTFDFGNANAILKAHRDFKRMRKNYSDQPDHNILPDIAGGKVNLLTEYYLKGVRKWSGLTNGSQNN